MAQDIILNGIVLEDVPALKVPKDGGGYAMFTDVTDTTAAAADVASGKYFYTDAGVKTAGTASGGGGFVPKLGIIRSDATAIKTYTYDKLLNRDLSITIPTYSTSRSTLIASGSIETFTPSDSFDDYDFAITARALTYAVYNADTKLKGRAEAHINVAYWDIIKTDPGCITIAGVSNTARYFSVNGSSGISKLVFWNSSSELSISTVSNGPHQEFSVAAPSVNSSTGAITIKSPAIYISGHASFFSSDAWGMMTDIRAQYIVEVWKIPKDKSVDGGVLLSQVLSPLNDVMNNNRTLR